MARLIGLARPGCSTSSARRPATTASTRSGCCGRGRRHPGPGMVAAPACTQQWSLARCACAPKPAAGCAASAWLPFWPNWYPALEVEGALRLEPLVRSQLLAMSAATIDRRLRPYRLQLVRGFGATKPGSLLKSQVPIRTWTPWDEQRVGFLKIDLVAHCGITNAGQFLYTLVATDVASGWTECMGVPSKRQDDVFVALEAIRNQLPFVLLGLDSDNGSEFLNGHLVHYCQELPGAPPHLHPFTPVLEKRPSPRRAEKLVDRPQGDRLRPLRGRGRSGATQPRVRDPSAVDESLAAGNEARG